MLRKLFLFVLLILSTDALCAQQKAIISGRVLNAQTPLAGASVTVSRLKDSSQIASVITNSDGRFTIASLPQKDSLKITISFVGYAPFEGLLILADKRFVMAPVTLQPTSAQMDAVVIKVQKLVTVKGDTIEFNASAIKTPPNSVAVDLVKRVPGLELGRDGKLTYNGRPVTKILVDGKPFFSDDGSIALNNIPVQMIDKIQLATDSLKIGYGNMETNPGQVLNLKLRSGKKYVARGYVTSGTDQRYDGSLFASRIVDKDRISLVFGGNNVNKIGTENEHSFQLLTNGSGIIKTTFGAVNYGTKWKEGQSFNASYDFIFPLTTKESLREKRQDILTATALISSAHQSAHNSASNHRGNFSYDVKGKKYDVRLQTDVDYLTTDNKMSNGVITTDGLGNILNALAGTYRSSGNNYRTTVNIDGEKKIAKPGRKLQWLMSFEYKNDISTDHNDAQTNYYKNNTVDSQYHFRQQLKNDDHSTSASLFIYYLEPLTKHISLSFRNDLLGSFRKANRATWSLDSLGKQVAIDSLYSYAFANNNINNTTEVSFAFRNKLWYVSAGGSLLQNFTHQKDAIKETAISQTIYNPALATQILYNTSKTSWSLRTAAKYTLPTLQQLQPAADITNPLNIVEGNPALRPQINYRNNFSWTNKKLQVNGRPGAILNLIKLNWDIAHDKIINAVRYDTLGKQTTTFANVNGTYDLSAIGQFTFQKKWAGHIFSASIRPIINYKNDKTFINGILYRNQKIFLWPTINFNYRMADAISLLLTYSPSFNQLYYQQNTSLNQSYTVQETSLDIDLYLLKRIKMSQSIGYSYNNSLPDNYKNSSLLWNASASYLCLKNKRGEVTLNAFDILRRFNNLDRHIGSNYIEDTQSNNLQRYFMMGFKYSFGKQNAY